MPADKTLAKLKDIHLPPEISFWPPAPGWWILALLIVLIIFFFGRYLLRKHERKKPAKEALRLLKVLENNYEKNHEDLATLRNLSQLLRRFALLFFQQEEVASLSGTAWLEFLDNKGQTTEFTQGVGNILGEQIYQQKPDFEMDVLFSLVKKWVVECSPAS